MGENTTMDLDVGAGHSTQKTRKTELLRFDGCMCRNGPSRKQGSSEVEWFKNFEDSISLTAVVTKCERREKSVRRPAVCASV